MFMTSTNGTGGIGTEKAHEPHHDSGANITSESPACDIITGNLRLYRFSAVTQSLGQEEATVDDSPGLAPTRFVVFNTVANTFVGVVENRITVWGANSGAKIEEPVSVRDAEVCAIAFDSPRERKLFVATNDGAIRLYNPVTGALLQKTMVHDGTVTSLVFCSHANCLVSTGDDRMICVLDSPPGKSNLEVMHFVEEAHKSTITCCTCSPPPLSNEVHTTSVHTREIRALHFPAATPGLLVSADVVGTIFIWPTIGVRSSTVHPLMRLVMQESTPSRSVQSKIELDGVTSICSTSISQDANAATHPAMLYIGIESGQIFAWDLRSFVASTHPDNQPTRRSAILRRRSSNSQASVSSDIQAIEGGIASRRTSAAQGPAALPVVASTKSWMAHLAGVLSLQSVPWPGELLSLGADGVVKIWDNTATCVGHILTTGEQSSASASAWKFGRRDHTVGGDQKEQFERIAREVITKHQRRLKKELHRQRKTGQQQQQPQSDQVVPDTSLSTPSSLLESESPSKMPSGTEAPLFPDASTALTHAANVLLSQAPFSVTSVTSGIQQGVFGPEEAQHLRGIAKNSTALLADVADKKKRIAALAPLFSTPEEMWRARAKAKSKARAMMNNGPPTPEVPSAASKTLTNYPLELERRAAAMTKVSVGALRKLDVEPSQFLLDKLQDEASSLSKPVKSTPKKRLQRASMESTGLDIKMDASVVILARNVSLPKLTPPSSVYELDGMALASSASAPALQPSPAPAESESPSPEKLRRSSNIARKLKLCQKIVANVCLMNSKPKVSKETEDHRHPVSPTSSMRHTPSTPALSPGKNPFGPHYTVKQVEQLAIGLARLDEDGSGDLNQQEWAQLVRFCGLEGSDRRNSATSVENLFYSIDKDSNGTISLRELLPTLFRHASPEQLQQMRALIQARMKVLQSRRSTLRRSSSALMDGGANSPHL
ncbi:Transcription initiation factor TFIID, subunit TAF5 [Phytophthora cinnamomi]|uniref:Transcription initiation factor TFIID, subunit TAF5 n=1 Tax=Phytophthora cinnamomi TaxID=4785 RepID=UPI00355A0A88|nr:Transcription initiation factor TFIID, subunit TAF5 [Phytophthora cinnamomi]